MLVGRNGNTTRKPCSSATLSHLMLTTVGVGLRHAGVESRFRSCSPSSGARDMDTRRVHPMY